MPQTQPPYPRFVRLGRAVHDLYGISRSTQYHLVKQGRLRPPRKISPQLQGWLREELEEDLFALQQQHPTPQN